MMNLWINTKLLSLPFSLRKQIKFFAPLLYSLDFHGIDPVSYTRVGTLPVTYRGNQGHTIAANVPPFEWTDDTPQGLLLDIPAALTFASANGLDSADTLIWFEDLVPKSTPTNTNPFSSGGAWNGILPVHLSNVVKLNAVISNSEINQIQTALTAAAQVIPEPPAPPVGVIGAFISENPSGVKNGSNKVFTLSQDPDLGSLALYWAGLYLKRVASAPAELEYTAGSTGNRTLTLGSAPESGQDLSAQYVISP